VESHLQTLQASVKWFVCCIQPLSLSLSLSLYPLSISPLSKPAMFIEKKTQISKPLRPQHQLFTKLWNHLKHTASIVCFQIVLPDPQVAVYIPF
jgi:hypothetical protein